MMSAASSVNWRDRMLGQIDFHMRSRAAARPDQEFDWSWYEANERGLVPQLKTAVKRALIRMGIRPGPVLSPDWIEENFEALWNTRCLLGDELSRVLFDESLIVRIVGPRRSYFPRTEFEDFINILSESEFDSPSLPRQYLGLPLFIFDAKLLSRPAQPPIRVITRRLQLQLVNSYRQYFVSRGDTDYSPQPGDVVFDCGACIGEISMIFAGLVAPAGEVHLFDPIELHTKFCRLHADINPGYRDLLKINTLAVGDRTHDALVGFTASEKIDPAAVVDESFACTTLDHYANANSVGADFIKMDIEGSEVAAINGAANLIREFRPRLAISGYHKPEDMWEIPNRILEINPGYKLAFGHHTPIVWESVFYAADNRVRKAA